MIYNLTFFRVLYESQIKACVFVVVPELWLSRGRQLHWAASKVNPMFSRFVLLVSSIKSKITAWVWRFNIHASTCKQLQTPTACLKWLALKGDWQRTKSVAGYLEHRSLARETHDALPSGKMTATTISTAIQQTAFEATFQASFASPHQTAHECVCVFVRLCIWRAVVLSATQQFTCATAVNPLCLEVRGIELLHS